MRRAGVAAGLVAGLAAAAALTLPSGGGGDAPGGPLPSPLRAPLGSSSGGSINVFVGSTPTPAAGVTANLWVDSNGGTCARQGPAGAYSDAGACSTFDLAWDAATTGDLIRVVAATYASQTITGDRASETTIDVQGSTIAGLQASATHMTLKNATVSGNAVGVNSNDVTWQSVNLHGTETDLAVGANNFLWNGGEFGFAGWTPAARDFCGGANEPIEISGATSPTLRSVRLYKSAHIVDGTNTCDHLEYIRIDNGGSGAAFDRVWVESGDQSNTSTIFVTNPANGATYNGLTIRNSFVGDNESKALSVHENVDTCNNWSIDYVTFVTFPYAFSTAAGGACGTRTGMEFTGNLGPYASFQPCHGTHTKNRWQSANAGTCGTDAWTLGTENQVGALGFNTTTGVLNAGSIGIDGAEATCATSAGGIDYEGTTRPQGSACDNGWDER
jgi:hypothetical protein